MAVKLWWSEKPEYSYEYRAVKELCESLESRKETYFVFANYRIPDAQIDLTVFTNTSIFLIELKSSAGKPINGSSNGSWTREDGLIFDRNPINQIVYYYYNFRDWLTEHKEQFLTKNKAAALIVGVGEQGNIFNDIKKLIVLCPIKHPDSKINVDVNPLRPYMGNIIGFDELVNLIIDPSWESRLGIEFAPKEIDRMAELLHLKLVSLPTDTADLSVAPTESLGEARGVYEVHEKTKVPEKPTKKPHKPRFLGGAAIAVVIIGILLFLAIPRSPRVIDVTDATQYIGKNEEVRVLAYIDNVKVKFGKYIILYSGDFSVQVGPLDNPEGELSHYEEEFKRQCVMVGPARITHAESSDNPQIEFSSDDHLIIRQNTGRCK